LDVQAIDLNDGITNDQLAVTLGHQSDDGTIEGVLELKPYWLHQEPCSIPRLLNDKCVIKRRRHRRGMLRAALAAKYVRQKCPLPLADEELATSTVGMAPSPCSPIARRFPPLEGKDGSEEAKDQEGVEGYEEARKGQ
jgi:hypothetical protein